MKKIEYFWNYLFFSTWLLNIRLGEILIERPLIFIVNLSPFLRKRWEKGKNSFEKFKKDLDIGESILFSKYYMLSAATGFYGSLCVHTERYFDFANKSELLYYFFASVLLSWITNYLLLDYKSKYKRYFKLFAKSGNNKMFYVWGILFYLGVLIFFIFTIF